MELKVFFQNHYEINSYVLYDLETKKAYVIDPGLNGSTLIKFLKQNNLNVEMIFLTHGHGDHISDVPMILDNYDAKIYAHRSDSVLFESAEKNHSPMISGKIIEFQVDFFVDEGDRIAVGNKVMDVIHTPGHTKGGVCFYFENMLFTGDTLFKGSIGRTDLFGGNYDELLNSLVHIAKLDGETIIYPGHGPSTILRKELLTNPFYKGLI
jgi:metallo-beta-lactamase family protein